MNAASRPVPQRLPLCSDVSWAAGIDPIGTAPHWREVTVLELDTPIWDALRRVDAWTPRQVAVFAALREKTEASGAGFGLLMSDPRSGGAAAGGPLRVRHYVQGAGGFTRRDYQSDLPQSEWARGLHDTLVEPARLHGKDWAEQNVPDGPDYHVCTHGTVDAACGRYGVPVSGALNAGGARAWRTGHFGGHRFAATAVELPSGLLWAHLTPALALRVARREGHPAEVRKHLRGFAGLPALAQHLDRELLIRHGWGWLEASRWVGTPVQHETGPHETGLHETRETEGEQMKETTVRLDFRWNGEHGHASARVVQAAPLHLPGSSHSAELGSVGQSTLTDVQIHVHPARVH